MRTSKALLAKTSTARNGRFDSISWFFRANLPPRRAIPGPHPNEMQRREFFGLGEIVNVLANPSETVRSLTESRRLLQEAREEIQQNRERSQLRTTHTFSPLPNFFPRPAEVAAIERALEGTPSFTVLFGASSVGKTALLREVLSRDMYHVLHFDLRIAGFADLGSLYGSLSQQMEQYFESLSKIMEGYEDFEKEAWSFKHDRLTVEQRVENGGGGVKTSDIARLMELFQSSLLRYWQFEPNVEEPKEDETPKDTRNDSKRKSNRYSSPDSASTVTDHKETVPEKESNEDTKDQERPAKPPKKIPVIFFDEAHKLPALIHSPTTMKTLLDSMLVLTKQDRLCHVIHATSDAFYQTWLRQLNVMQHCKIISIGDCSKEETKRYFEERLMGSIPDELKRRGGMGLRMRDGREYDFESLFDAFGGKLAHWADFVEDFVNSRGELTIEQSSHFLQAYALLNLQLIHATEQDERTAQAQASRAGHTRRPSARSNSAGAGPGYGSGPGFNIYTPLHPSSTPFSHPPHQNAPFNPYHLDDDPSPDPPPRSSFTALQLLKVMLKLLEPGVYELPYFLLCRELGVQAVDDMVRGRVLELRWMGCVTDEYPSPPLSTGPHSHSAHDGSKPDPSLTGGAGAGIAPGGILREVSNRTTIPGIPTESDTETESDAEIGVGNGTGTSTGRSTVSFADSGVDSSSQMTALRTSASAALQSSTLAQPSHSHFSAVPSSASTNETLARKPITSNNPVRSPTNAYNRDIRTQHLHNLRQAISTTPTANTNLTNMTVAGTIPTLPTMHTTHTAHTVHTGLTAPTTGTAHTTTHTAPIPTYNTQAFGPKLVPMTPILKYAMREVVKEYDIVYEEERSDSRMSRNRNRTRGHGRSGSKGHGGNWSGGEGDRSTYTSFEDVEEY